MPAQPAWFHRLAEILDTPRTRGEILILSVWRVWFDSRSRDNRSLGGSSGVAVFSPRAASFLSRKGIGA